MVLGYSLKKTKKNSIPRLAVTPCGYLLARGLSCVPLPVISFPLSLFVFPLLAVQPEVHFRTTWKSRTSLYSGLSNERPCSVSVQSPSCISSSAPRPEVYCLESPGSHARLAELLYRLTLSTADEQHGRAGALVGQHPKRTLGAWTRWNYPNTLLILQYYPSRWHSVLNIV